MQARRQTIQEYNKEYIEDVLARMNKCDTVCTDLGDRPITCGDKSLTSVDWLLENLPGANYVLDRMVNYIFANGLITGLEEQDRRLEIWLYETKNRMDSTNYAELRECVKRTLAYGECGLRALDGNIYHVPVGYYGELVNKEDGLEEVVAYFIRKDRERVTATITMEEWQYMESFEDIEQWFGGKGYILLDKDSFRVIKNNTSSRRGESPLHTDKMRVDLLTGVYDQLNYDIRYDGPGRIFFRTKSGYVAGDENDISTGTVLNNSQGSKEQRLIRAKEEVAQLLRDIKNSSSDSAGVLSGAFEKDYIYLPRVTKGTEFLNWLDVDTVVMAQIFGMSPTLVEVGKLHGNISVEKIIDNAMTNTIVPMREMLATQFSEFIAKLVGVSKVYFNKYDMQQAEDENKTRLKIADIILRLSNASKNTQSEDVTRLMDEVAEVLRTSLYDEHGELRSMN